MVQSDHNPLVKLRKNKDQHGKFDHWLMETEEFSFDIHYKPGKLNIVPNALSGNVCQSTPTMDDLDDKILHCMC